MKTWQFALGLGTVFVVGIIVVAVVRLQLPTQSTPAATLDIEIAKAALTGCIVAVIGAVIGALVKAREQRVQAMRLQADLLGQFIQQLGEHYRSVKATRRRLRSFGLTTRYEKPPDELSDEQRKAYKDEIETRRKAPLGDEQLKAYEDAMETIGKAQLAIENFVIQFRRMPFFGDIKDIAPWLTKMEDYLRVIQKEHEEKMSQARSGKRTSFAELCRLSEFTADVHEPTSPVPVGEEKSDYRFDSHFAKPYDRIWERISRNLKILSDA